MQKGLNYTSQPGTRSILYHGLVEVDDAWSCIVLYSN